MTKLFPVPTAEPQMRSPKSTETPLMLLKMRSSLAGEDDENLVFVHISCPDDLKARGTRRTVRRHAMRETGKSRRSRKRIQTWELSVKEQTCEDDAVSIGSSQGELLPFSARKPVVFDPYNAAYYPIQLDDRTMQLIHFSKPIVSYRIFMD